ncbi:4Fe-4S binding protein [Chloroflexota bacterium]
MIANYGYRDGSGAYYITIDTEKCDGCEKCVEACSYGVLEVGPDENDPMSDGLVAKVTDTERKKLKYTCMPCKPVTGRQELPCIQSCQTAAIVHSW